ncbi:DUF3027 domain-containing protein [Nocardia sp. NPDC060220]|uniref:DUF3027 domain-containing protein n=1 Tax=Nocardia sp. NPDC060220 TaxID=3347076 RepID=UPI003656BC0C
MSAVSVSESGVRPVLADAAEVARRALVALEPDGVGVHLGVSAEDDTAATHRFEATLPGYRGWQWAVVVAAPPGADHATVSESALLPALDALIAPDFVPWEQRVRPGDLGPGDLLAAPADDPRLVPGYVATGDPVIDEVAREVGLGRVQVLSLEGRADAAQRWFTEFGPDTEMAKAAPGTCGMCGFYLPLAGALRESFGVCGNAMGADGHVVHIEYGCGAHSDVVAPSGNGSPLYEAFDDHAVDFVEIVRPAVEDAIDKATSQAAGADSATEAAAEMSADAPASAVPTTGADSASAAAVRATGSDSASAAAVRATGSDSASAAAAPATGEDSASETASQATAEVSATVVDQVEAEPAGADPATTVVEVVAETSADPAIEVVEVAAETVAAVPPTSDTETEPSSADSLTEVGEAAAERAGDRQETAEAEAVAAADAERHALTEGALPESADEVVTAEIASDTGVPAETVSAEPTVEAELAVGDESATAETSAASDAESSSGVSDEVATAADAVAEAAPAAETVSGAEASAEGEAAVSGAEASVEGEAAVSGAEASVEGEAAVSDAEASAEGEAAVSGDAGSGEAAESADLSEHGSSVSR